MLIMSVATVAVDKWDAYFPALTSASCPRVLLLTKVPENEVDDALRLAGVST